MNIKKVLLVVLAIATIAVPLVTVLNAGDAICGCADTYMGAKFVMSICHFDPITGQMDERYCWYEY